MFSAALLSLAKSVLDEARRKKLRIVCAESCTGGLVAGLLSEIPGASDVLERGFVTYSNEAKEEMLGVPHHFIETFGAVSEAVACAMARATSADTAPCSAISAWGTPSVSSFASFE